MTAELPTNYAHLRDALIDPMPRPYRDRFTELCDDLSKATSSDSPHYAATLAEFMPRYALAQEASRERWARCSESQVVSASPEILDETAAKVSAVLGLMPSFSHIASHEVRKMLWQLSGVSPLHEEAIQIVAEHVRGYITQQFGRHVLQAFKLKSPAECVADLRSELTQGTAATIQDVLRQTVAVFRYYHPRMKLELPGDCNDLDFVLTSLSKQRRSAPRWPTADYLTAYLQDEHRKTRRTNYIAAAANNLIIGYPSPSELPLPDETVQQYRCLLSASLSDKDILPLSEAAKADMEKAGLSLADLQLSEIALTKPSKMAVVDPAVREGVAQELKDLMEHCGLTSDEATARLYISGFRPGSQRWEYITQLARDLYGKELAVALARRSALRATVLGVQAPEVS